MIHRRDAEGAEDSRDRKERKAFGEIRKEKRTHEKVKDSWPS
jgi:hypothetical protein